MIRSLLVLCVLVAHQTVFSQQTANNKIELKGILVDEKSNARLPYVNIGIVNKSLGTVSDTTGNFSLYLTPDNLKDTLQMSLVGYHTKRLLVDEFMAKFNNQTIDLQSREYMLDEIKISGKKETSEIAGRSKSGGFIQFAMHPKKEIVLGTEIGMKFKAETYPARLKDFSWFFSGNNFKKIKFRVNIYSLKNNLPDSLILKKELYVDVVDYKTGWTKVDLEQYDIVVTSDFAISIQWLEHAIKEGENPKVFIPGAISSSNTSYFRVASQDKWTKTKSNLCYYVTLLH